MYNSPTVPIGHGWRVFESNTCRFTPGRAFPIGTVPVRVGAVKSPSKNDESIVASDIP